MTALSREKCSGCASLLNIHGVEDTKTRAVSSLVTTWVLICLHCLEEYMLQNAGNCVWRGNEGLSSAHPLSYPFQHRLSCHLPYQFFIFCSLPLLNADAIYHVPILNFNLKKCSVFIRLVDKWDFGTWVKEGMWCHYINCNLTSLKDRAFIIIVVPDLLSL